ncbi:MAG: bifunctional phosphoribosyl-AMP cyclohydrolase/phosphoribosyl-ATP diphosphatase HisIE [Eubacteriales bacterium]
MIDPKLLKYNAQGLIPAIIQHHKNGEVLMLAYMSYESLQKTLDTNTTWFYSRSRNKLWNKGETSGNFQNIKDIRYDCDEDTLLILVDPAGPSCHTGSNSCFYRHLREDFDPNITDLSILQKLYETIQNRKKNPLAGSYTNYLFENGVDKILKKVGEESTETVIAAKNDSKEELIYESADLIYHLLVLLVNQGVSLNDITRELTKRHKD